MLGVSCLRSCPQRSIAANFASDLVTGRRAGGQTDVLRRGIQPGNQTWIDLLRHQGWVRFGRRERLRLPALSRNRRNAPWPRRRAMENIREARCDVRLKAMKPG